MSKLKKITIKGIRSFSPFEQNTVEFFSPFTLIVGTNGTGKTTIIESLKYITTGDMPPNSKNGAFIYDPKIAKEIDVRAEIELVFINNNNEELKCTRSLQSTSKKNKTEMKTLETTLQKNGILISSKMADIDRDVPHYLGVSKSILNNVIFCHQDDTNWPFSDPAIMKKHLDDIFSSTKYNKALLGFKSSKKELSSDLKLKNQQLSFILKDKMKKDDLSKNLKNLEEDITKKSKKLEVFSDEIKRINKNLAQLKKEMEVYSELEESNRILKIEFDKHTRYIQNFGHEILDGDLSQIKMKNENDLKILEQKYNDLNKSTLENEFNNIEAKRKSILETTARNSKISNMVESMEAQIAELEYEKKQMEGDTDNILMNVDKEFNSIQGMPACYSNQDYAVQEDNKLKAASDGINHCLNKNIKLITLKLKRLEEYINNKMEELDRAKQENFLRQSQINEIVKEVKSNKAFINEMENSKEILYDISDLDNLIIKKDEVECLVNNLNIDLNQKQSELNEAFRKSELAFKRVHLEKELETLKSENMNLNFDKISQEIKLKINNLEAEKSSLKELEKTQIIYNQMKIANINKVKNILDLYKMIDLKIMSNMTLNNSDKIDSNKILQLDREFKKVINSLDDHNIDKINHRNILNIANMLLLEKIDYSRYEKELEEANSIISVSLHASSVYQNFCNLGDKKNECPLCKNKFDKNTNDKSDYMNRLKKVISKIPISIDNAVKRKEDLVGVIDRCKGDNFCIEKHNYIVGKIINILNEMVFVKNSDLNENCISSNISDLEKEIYKLNVKKDVFKENSIKIKNLENQLINIPQAIDLSELKNGVKSLSILLKSEKDKLLVLTEKIAILESFKFKNERIMKNQSLKERNEKLLKELEILNSKKIELNYDPINLLKNKATKFKIDFESKVMRFGQIEDSIKDKLCKISNIKSRLVEIDLLIVFNNITYNIISDYDIMKNIVMDLKSSIIQITRELSKVQLLKKIIDENISLNASKKIVLELKKDIEKYDFTKVDLLKEKINNYNDKISKTSSNESIIKGELKQMILTANNFKIELETNYKNTSRNYIKTMLEIKALELSMEDLEKCINALDKAIVDFHSSKIDEVNRVLKELWVETYKGNDIDYIELKSESTEAKAYNYRIVMVKNNVEIDMRGRSSAGQKMIASLLFRIALADSFSVGCNVLALDEPTTNLDKDNIESLSYTLSQIIKERSNVQLIVITHDEDFIQMLNREGVENYYRLKRDSKGCGRVLLQTIYG